MKKTFLKKISITIGILLFTRLLAHIPIPVIQLDVLKIAMQQYSNSTFQLLNQMTGNAFENMTLTGLGVTPYITASIIIQLLCITFRSLGNLKRDGYYGQKKVEKITTTLGIIMSVFVAILSSIALKNLGYLTKNSFLYAGITAVCLCAGAVLLIVCGKIIEKKGIGNGISLILGANIISTFSSDIITISNQKTKTLVILVLTLAIIIGILLFMETTSKDIKIYNTTILDDTDEKVDELSVLPIKLGICNVMPLILVATFYQIYSLIVFFVGNNKMLEKAEPFFSTSTWFTKVDPLQIAGIVFYCIIIFVTSYLYADMILNPVEIASNLKKDRSFIPNVRPGNDTVAFIRKERRGVVFVNAMILMILAIVPILITNQLHVSLNIGSTSLIIVVGVLIEFTKAVKADFYGLQYGRTLKKIQKAGERGVK